MALGALLVGIDQFIVGSIALAIVLFAASKPSDHQSALTRRTTGRR